MQFAVPQFTDVEDKLIGPLTLKQFLILLATGGLVLFFWSALGPSFIFFILALPISCLGLAIALGKYNGRSLFAYAMPFANFVTSTKVMVFKRESDVISVSKTDLKPKEQVKEVLDDEPTESRLKKLAYLLDKKTAEEGDMLSRDDRHAFEPALGPKLEMKKVFSTVKEDILSTARKLDAGHMTSVRKSEIPEIAEMEIPVPEPEEEARPARRTRTASGQSKPKSKKFDASSILMP